MRKANPRRSKKKTTTTGRDDFASGTARKDYYVSGNLETTPHPNQRLVSMLGKPIMDRKFKYSTYEGSITGGGATSQTPISLVTINQGTTDITRTGDRIRVRRIHVRGRLTGGLSAVGAATARVLFVIWNPVGAGAVNAPVSGQVLQGSAGYMPFSAYSRDYGDSYQVVHDSTHEVKSAAGQTIGPEMEFVYFDRAVTVDMEFSAGATTPTTNNLYVFVVSDTTAAAGYQPVLLLQSTLWYEDLDA